MFTFSSALSIGATVRWMSPELLNPNERNGTEKTLYANRYAFGAAIYQVNAPSLFYYRFFSCLSLAQSRSASVGYPAGIWGTDLTKSSTLAGGCASEPPNTLLSSFKPRSRWQLLPAPTSTLPPRCPVIVPLQVGRRVRALSLCGPRSFVPWACSGGSNSNPITQGTKSGGSDIIQSA